MIIVLSTRWNPSCFIQPIGFNGAKLFMSINENIISQRHILGQGFNDDLAMAKLLSKAAPLKDLYFYLRTYSSKLGDPVRAEVSCVEAYLEVSFYRFTPLMSSMLIHYS